MTKYRETKEGRIFDPLDSLEFRETVSTLAQIFMRETAGCPEAWLDEDTLHVRLYTCADGSVESEIRVCVTSESYRAAVAKG